MGFRNVNIDALTKFNSADSQKFINMYEGFVLSDINRRGTEPSSKSFAPSSIRCKRKSWFRLRGVEKCIIKNPDRSLEFKAMLGTSIHMYVQSILVENLKSDWVEVDKYIKSTELYKLDYFKEYNLTPNDFETQIELPLIPIRFSVDGIFKLDNAYNLLEIKTADHSDFMNLTDIKECHIDQVITYASLLNLSNIFVMYVDRQYGDVKCYTHRLKEYESDKVFDSIKSVLECVDSNIAPSRLDYSDYMCTNCEYKQKCKEWG